MTTLKQIIENNEAYAANFFNSSKDERVKTIRNAMAGLEKDDALIPSPEMAQAIKELCVDCNYQNIDKIAKTVKQREQILFAIFRENAHQFKIQIKDI